MASAADFYAQRLEGTAVERPRDQPPHGVPLALRSAQHVFVSDGQFEQTWSKRMVLIQWVISGQAAMAVGGKRLTYQPGDVAIYLPSLPLRFWAVSPVNEMCWFTVDGRLAEQFALELELSPGVYPYGPAPLERIYEMMDSLKGHTVQDRRRASLLAIRALYDLADIIRTAQAPSLIQQTQHIIQENFADPNLSVESIAQRLLYHRGSLSRLFHKHTGVSMIDYITQVRLAEARSLLAHTPDKIVEVARKCGFREAAYFCRWLKKNAGVTPKDLRISSQK